MTQPPRLSPDSLLAHEPFVRAVVRDLLRDEQRVQDVLQETWIRALDTGPREGGSLKGWLASVARRLALDQHRGDARRERRERETARGEALESVDALHARLEAQREVVDAVLALEEPYKSVVLLAYYERLSPDAIAARLGRSSATVRSQLSRAHEILRRKLDAHHGGERSAWAGLLLPWALATKSKAGLLAAAGIGVALIGAGVWVLPRVLAPGGSEPAPITNAALESEPAAPVELAAAAASQAREPIPAVSRSQSAASSAKPDLSRLQADELRDLAVQAMRTLERKVLTPDARYLEEQQALLALPDTGVTKVLLRTQGSSPYEGLLLPRGGGTYFSFATLSHDDGREPDIEYENGFLHAGCYGAAVGMLVDVGEVDLLRYSPRASVLPGGNPEFRREAWESLFATPETDDVPGARTLQARMRELSLRGGRAKARTTYLVRVLSLEEHDHLVALRVLALDGESMTIAWRVLERFPHAAPKREGSRKPDWESVPPSPDWIEQLDKQQLVALIHEIRTHAHALLLATPEPLQLENEWRMHGASLAGFFRLLPRDRFVPAVEAPEGGTRYSFETREHTDRNHQIEGNPEWLSAPFLLDLGKLDGAEYQAVLAGRCPASLAGTAQQSWSFLWAEDGTSERGLGPEARKRWEGLRSDLIRTQEGHGYLLRAIDPEADTDRLVLLSVIETSDNGSTLCWRELKRFD